MPTPSGAPKIVQIAIGTGPNGPTIAALDEEGGVSVLTYEQPWRKLPPLPEPTKEPATEAKEPA